MFSCYLKQEIFRLFRWARTWAVLFPFLCSLSFQFVFKKESTRDEQSHDGLEQVERATQAFWKIPWSGLQARLFVQRPSGMAAPEGAADMLTALPPRNRRFQT